MYTLRPRAFSNWRKLCPEETYRTATKNPYFDHVCDLGGVSFLIRTHSLSSLLRLMFATFFPNGELKNCMRPVAVKLGVTLPTTTSETPMTPQQPVFSLKKKTKAYTWPARPQLRHSSALPAKPGQVLQSPAASLRSTGRTVRHTPSAAVSRNTRSPPHRRGGRGDRLPRPFGRAPSSRQRKFRRRGRGQGSAGSRYVAAASAC